MRKHSKASNIRKKQNARRSSTRGLKLVALFEGAKGFLVLAAGFGLLTIIHADLHQAAIKLVERLHFNPARHYPRIFLDLTEHVTDGQLWALACAALIYSIVRFVEATGLWLEKKWAEWFGVLTGGMYIPVELYEVTRGASWPKVTLLAVNIGVVSYLLLIMSRNREREERDVRY